MKNVLVARIFYEIADMLEMKDVEFKPQAYRKAARNIETLSESIEDVAARGELENIPGVGKAISEKIQEIVDTGRLKSYEKMKKEFPVDLDSLLRVEGIGAKKVKMFYKKLGVRTLKDLEKAAKAGKISKLPGMGEKSEKRILEGIKFAKSSGSRTLLGYAIPMAEEIRKKVQAFKYVEKAEFAGSVRRMKETIGDIDVLVVTSNPKEVVDNFTSLDNVSNVVSKGKGRSTVRLKEQMECDLRMVDKKSFGSAMIYFTGSKEHNVALRRVAIKKGWKLSEYGLFDNDKQIAGTTERSVYSKLGMQFIEPEIRENTGEIQLALKKKLPKLVKYTDIKGDLHMHSNWSDGVDSIENMARSAKSIGHEYICITDHLGTLKIASSIASKDVDRYCKEIDSVSKKVGIPILKGVEIDIRSGGKLDITDKVLEKFDIVVASIHSGFRQGKKKMTDRIISAMENEHIDIIGHPTGRKIGVRAAYELDFEKIFDVSKRTGTVLEVNSYPIRLDLNSDNIRNAIESGCKLAINTDSHNSEQLRYIRLGIGTARRGWTRKSDIVNTNSLKKLMNILK